MSVINVGTYVVRAERRDDLGPALEGFLPYKEANPELFFGLRSWRLFRQELGGVAGMYVEMWEG